MDITKRVFYVDGSRFGDVILPDATRAKRGLTLYIISNGDGPFDVRRFGEAFIFFTIGITEAVEIILVGNSTSLGDWIRRTATRGTS